MTAMSVIFVGNLGTAAPWQVGPAMKVQVYGHLELISVPLPILLGALSRPTLALVRSGS